MHPPRRFPCTVSLEVRCAFFPRRAHCPSTRTHCVACVRPCREGVLPVLGGLVPRESVPSGTGTHSLSPHGSPMPNSESRTGRDGRHSILTWGRECFSAIARRDDHDEDWETSKDTRPRTQTAWQCRLVSPSAWQMLRHCGKCQCLPQQPNQHKHALRSHCRISRRSTPHQQLHRVGLPSNVYTQKRTSVLGGQARRTRSLCFSSADCARQR